MGDDVNYLLFSMDKILDHSMFCSGWIIPNVVEIQYAVDGITGVKRPCFPM